MQRLRLPVLSLLLLSGCAWQYPHTTSESMKGKGNAKSYDASYEAVWNTALTVVDEFNMEIIKKEQTEKENRSGYIEASKPSGIDRTELFVEAGADNRSTQLEVASEAYRFVGDLEEQIQLNVDRHLKDSAWQTSWIHNTPWYLKLSIMLPGRGETVPLHMTNDAGEAIRIEPENGGAVSLDLGYRINRALSAEVSYGNDSFGTTNCLPACDTSDPGYREGFFSSDFISTSLLYHFYRSVSGEAHISGGLEYHFSSELTRASATVDTVVSYDDTTGYHAGIGGSLGRELFIFADLNYAFGLTYKYSQMKENGMASTAIYPEWREIHADGFYTSFGLGYRF